ncbi:MAG TPA: PLDc N-terminal domain-containing protein [Actinomycetota bacterium]
MTRKRWSELSGRQQAATATAAVVQAALAAATLWDVRRRPSGQIRGSKKLWVAAAFVNFVGPLAYFTVGRRRG